MVGSALKGASVDGGSVSFESKLGKKSVILVVIFLPPDRDTRRFWLWVCVVKIILCFYSNTFWEQNKCCENFDEFPTVDVCDCRHFYSRCVVLLAVGFFVKLLTKPTSRPRLHQVWTGYKNPSRFVRKCQVIVCREKQVWLHPNSSGRPKFSWPAIRTVFVTLEWFPTYNYVSKSFFFEFSNRNWEFGECSRFPRTLLEGYPTGH